MRRALIKFARTHHFGGAEYGADEAVAEVELPSTLTAQRLESCIRSGIVTIIPIESSAELIATEDTPAQPARRGRRRK